MRKLIAWIRGLFAPQALQKGDYIDWAKVPEEANVVVCDDDRTPHAGAMLAEPPYPSQIIPGGWAMPRHDDSRWLYHINIRDAIIAPLPPWRESLRKRPGSDS
jgi:hypothetical protein